MADTVAEPAEAGTRKRVQAWAGVLLLAVYVLPVYFPPGSTAALRLEPDAGLWTRLFPHVPGWWMALRLSALGLGAALLAWAGHDAGILTPHPVRNAPCLQGHGAVRWYERGALVVAGLLVVVATRAAIFTRWAQVALVIALLAPAVLLRMADTSEGTGRRSRGARERVWWGAVTILVTGWVLWRVAFANHDPRAADFVDVWTNFGFFVDAANNASNLITQQAELTALSNLHLLALGLPLVGPGKIEPSVGWVHAVHAIWIILTASGVACLARRVAGPPAMLAAVAAFLFSPFMMSMAIVVGPFALVTALAAALLLLVWRVYEYPSRADIAALGALAGLSATFPHLTLWAVAATVAVLPLLLRRRPSLTVWVIAALTGVAAVVPILPNLTNMSKMNELYVERRGESAELEQLILGQKFFSHRDVEALWHAGVRGTLDVPVAAVLQPFAIPRSPVRLSGDVYFEPLGAALAAVGLAVCIGLARRTPAARALLVAMVLALLPGAAASAIDRASLTRNLVTPVLLPLFSVVGLAVVGRALRLRLSAARLAIVLATTMALSGVVIFDVVNPRIVATTWLGLTLRALATTPAEKVLLLEHGNPRNDWLHVPEIARYLPPKPLAVRAYQNAGSLLSTPDGDLPAAPLIFWSPGLEEQGSVQRALCACWPQATLYTLQDAAGLSRAFGARLQGALWEPALPRRQWWSSPCADRSAPPFSCETLRAMAHDTLGQLLAEHGKLDEAVAHYREALRLQPGYATAHNSLGLALAAEGSLEEAIVHYREALRLDPELAPAHNNLAIALEGVGQAEEAIAHYREAVRIAPSDPLGRLNLGAVLAGRGRPDEALAQFREAVRQSPGLPEGHLALADALAQQGHQHEAIGEYREALRDRAGWPPAADRLAWLLATTEDSQLRDPTEAVSLAAEAVRNGDGTDAEMLRTLAAAYAAAGRSDEAVVAAERALGLAQAAGQDDLARDLAQRLASYRAGRQAR